MNLYSERQGFRKPHAKTELISFKAYNLLFNCCEEFFCNLAWAYPSYYDKEKNTCFFDNTKFNDHLFYIIPNLHRNNSNNISKLELYRGKIPAYDQYALLDFIEYLAQNIKDVNKETMGFFSEVQSYALLETRTSQKYFREKINNIFNITRLLYYLNESFEIERVIENNQAINQTLSLLNVIEDTELSNILSIALIHFQKPKPNEIRIGLEKIWDAFERMKTNFIELNKSESSIEVINKMSNNQSEFKEIFESEFKYLTTIGNNFHIRHFETDKIIIHDLRHVEYLFNRCLALILTGIKFLF